MEWRTIESAPAGVPILTFAEWDDANPVGVSSFVVVRRVREEVEHESSNSKGRRRIIQEVEYTEREWAGAHWEPSHWMPLPPPPKD